MKKTLALLALAGALPLAAQSFEVGALYTWNPGHANTVSVGGPSSEIKADTWKAAGLRVGYNFVSVGPMEFQGNATMQFNNKQDITVNGQSAPAPGSFTEEYKYWAVGAAVNWNFLVRLGVGLEYRSERLHFNQSYAGVTQYDGATTYGRAWVRGTAGFTIPAPFVKPFIGAEVAFPLSTKSLTADDLLTNNIDNLNKSLAPKAQYGIYAGIRF
ncbi:MAG TPA: hypothetical protein VFT46_11820 [Holophagaceae bacterium]|nr:hypothetical protein [Holophagaceae bacterium]